MGDEERTDPMGRVNHLALVCSDMARTVDFYDGVLGMPLIKTIELPAGMGQHFFFDCGDGDSLAFFWFPDAPPAAPGIAAPGAPPGRGDLTSAIGSMNHVAFDVPADQIDEYRDRLNAEGVAVQRGGQPRRQRVRASARRCTPACSCGRSTSRTPTGSCSSSLRGPACSHPTTSATHPPPRRSVDRELRGTSDAPPRPGRPRPTTTRRIVHRHVRPAVRPGPRPGRRTAAPPPARPATGGPCSRSCPTCCSTPSTASRCTRARSGCSTRVLRELGQTRVGWAARQPVRVLAALQVVPGARESARSRSRPSPTWQVADCFDRDRAGGARLHRRPRLRRRPGRRRRLRGAAAHLCDEEILELTYITALYDMHAVMSRGAAHRVRRPRRAHRRGRGPERCLRARRPPPRLITRTRIDLHESGHVDDGRPERREVDQGGG